MMPNSAKRLTRSPMGNFYPSGNTAKKIGKEYGVSKATIERDAEFSKAVDKVAKSR